MTSSSIMLSGDPTHALAISEIDANVLRPLLDENKPMKVGGTFVRTLRELYNGTLDCVFPHQIRESSPGAYFVTDRDTTEKAAGILQEIALMRIHKNYKGDVPVQNALDTLEKLATLAPEVHQTIIEKLTPAQSSELENKFREFLGDPVQRVIIGSEKRFGYTDMKGVLPKINFETLLRLKS